MHTEICLQVKDDIVAMTKKAIAFKKESSVVERVNIGVSLTLSMPRIAYVAYKTFISGLIEKGNIFSCLKPFK